MQRTTEIDRVVGLGNELAEAENVVVTEIETDIALLLGGEAK